MVVQLGGALVLPRFVEGLSQRFFSSGKLSLNILSAGGGGVLFGSNTTGSGSESLRGGG